MDGGAGPTKRSRTEDDEKKDHSTKFIIVPEPLDSDHDLVKTALKLTHIDFEKVISALDISDLEKLYTLTQQNVKGNVLHFVKSYHFIVPEFAELQALTNNLSINMFKQYFRVFSKYSELLSKYFPVFSKYSELFSKYFPVFSKYSDLFSKYYILICSGHR